MTDTSPLSRRLLLRNAGITAGALLAPGLLSACASEATGSASAAASSGPLSRIKSKSLVFADFGGTTRAARQTAYFDSFTKETGVKVVTTIPADAKMYAMEDGEDGPYDELPVGQYELYGALEHDSMATLPSDVTRNDQVEKRAQPYAWASFVIANTQAYLPGTFDGRGPQTWAEFWDVKKFPGKRAWPGTAGSADYSIERALLADGVAPEDLYPLDFERGFAKLDELRSHMVFFTSYPQIQQFLTSKTAAVAVGPNGLFRALQNQGTDVTIVFNEAFLSPNISVTTKKAAHKDGAWALAQWCTDGKRQATFASLTGYGPGNESAFEHISDKVLATLPNGPANKDKTISPDNTALAKVYSDYVKKYAAWLSKG
ncbi:extracellular solute-binding protein [Streptomyces sp. NPDC059373]